MSNELVLFYLVGILIVFGFSLTVFFSVSYFKWMIPSWASSVLVISFAYVPVLQILKLYTMHMYVDFSHWEELLWNIIQGGLPLSLSSEFIFAGTEKLAEKGFSQVSIIFENIVNDKKLAKTFGIKSREKTVKELDEESIMNQLINFILICWYKIPSNTHCFGRL